VARALLPATAEARKKANGSELTNENDDVLTEIPLKPGVDIQPSAIAEEDQKVIVRSNGTVGYVGKDIAYHMWKFGLLGRDFRLSQVLSLSQRSRMLDLGNRG
jgi:arginyl-tRNA synthetase